MRRARRGGAAARPRGRSPAEVRKTEAKRSPKQPDLYKIICDRYERASTVITSNRDFGEWPTVFSNPLMGAAAMDRLGHRAVKLVIVGKSYRVENFVKRSKRSSLPTAEPK